MKFDLPGERPPRFRLLYRPVAARTYEVVELGLRDHHAIFQAAVRRL